MLRIQLLWRNLKQSEKLYQLLAGLGEILILAWTTTPWTLPSNTALTVGPKIDYVCCKTFNQYTFLPTNVVAKNWLENNSVRIFC
jgi:isoleucyl-tRNA synthetase